MNKEEIVSVLQASLLLYDGMPEDEVRELVGDKYVGSAKYITNFLRSYRI